MRGVGPGNAHKGEANGCLAAVTQFQFIVTMIAVMKCLSALKPLSIQLQK